jgi:hypothetical protein
MAKLFRIYMDDSGNVDPATTNHPNQRYGSITAVILEADYLDTTFNASFAAIVQRHFGTNRDGSPLNLHRRVLSSHQEHGPFAVLRDEAKRAAWDKEALRMFERAPYVVISACVDKVEWHARFPTWAGDFYEVLVQAALERAFYFLRGRGTAEVNIETKGPVRDKRLKEQYRSALTNGYRYIPADKLRSVFNSIELNILTKADCKPGVQLADLIAGPAMQHIRFLQTGRHPIKSPFVAKLCRILDASKFYREGSKGPEGYGRIWRPKPQN